MPNNAGFYRPITVIAPEGCFVNPRFPAALGARGQGGHRVRMVVMGALAMLLPELMPACAGGSEFGIVIAGQEPQGGSFMFHEFHNMTGHGASPDHDGQDAGPWCLGNLANVPVEVAEAEAPVRIEEYAFLPDTGGAGRFRGGLGIARQYRLLVEKAMAQVRSDRQRSQPWGLAGGGPGSHAACLLNPAARDPAVAGEVPAHLAPGRRAAHRDVWIGRPRRPSGARPAHGAGRPALQGKVTPEGALRDYGVVVDPSSLELDEPATVTRRAQRKME